MSRTSPRVEAELASGPPGPSAITAVSLPWPAVTNTEVLCWLALLLIRIIETTTGDTWNNVRAELQRLAVGTFTGPAGTYRQSTVPTPAQRTILERLDIDAPPRILQLGTQLTD